LEKKSHNNTSAYLTGVCAAYRSWSIRGKFLCFSSRVKTQNWKARKGCCDLEKKYYNNTSINLIGVCAGSAAYRSWSISGMLTIICVAAYRSGSIGGMLTVIYVAAYRSGSISGMLAIHNLAAYTYRSWSICVHLRSLFAVPRS
jgi:hypothetical protein